MKKSILIMILSIVSLFVITGCGEDTPQKEGTKEVAQKGPAVSIEKRKAAFQKRLEGIVAAGFDLNQTAEQSYVLTIKDTKAAASSFLSMVNMATLDPQSRKLLENAIAGAKVGVEVDWKAYAANSQKSVFIYFMGNGKESAALQKMITEKKIGAYLTLDSDENIKKVDFKDINEKIVQGVETISLVLKGAQIDIKKAATEASPSRAFTIKGGEFQYGFENNGTKEIAFSYLNPVCVIDKSNAYLGKQICDFPLIQIEGGEGNDSFSVAFKKSHMDYDVTLHGKKIKADASFKIPNIDILVKDEGDDVVVHLKEMMIEGFSDNMDESLMKEFYLLATTPQKDINATVAKSMKLLGEMLSNGAVIDYKMGLASLEGSAQKAGKTTTFMMDTYLGEAKVLFDKTLNYHEKATIKHISVKEEKATTPLFDLKGFRFGYAVKDMVNFFPAFMEFAGMLSQKQQQGEALSKAEEEKIAAIGYSIVNHGMGLSFSPVGIDSISMESMGQQMSYGKMDLNIDATLAKNDIKFDNPMAAMMLLSFLQADGKLVLNKTDLDKMSNQFPPQAMAMVMMYAKYEGDKAVFVLKFEKGHLLVNDKPVM